MTRFVLPTNPLKANRKEGIYTVDLKEKIALILSEILSDKHEAVVKLRFEKKVAA